MQAKFSALILVFVAFFANADTGLNLDAHRGKIVLVDFLVSWCVPCRLSFSWLNQMQEKYAGEGLHIIGVNLDRNAEDATAFGVISHVNHRDVSMVAIARAPIEKIETFRQRMGWNVRWVSSNGNTLTVTMTSASHLSNSTAEM